MFTEDTCCGFPLYDMGHMDGMKDMAAETLALFEKYKPDVVLTSCPGCFEAIGHFWKEKLGLSHDYQVMDISQFLVSRIEGKCAEIDKRVTWHDPCVLGRHLGEYEAPRTVINSVPGIDFVEMAEHHDKSACCAYA